MNGGVAGWLPRPRLNIDLNTEASVLTDVYMFRFALLHAYTPLPVVLLKEYRGCDINISGRRRTHDCSNVLTHLRFARKNHGISHGKEFGLIWMPWCRDAPQAVVCLGKGCIDATALCDDSAAAAAFVAPADRCIPSHTSHSLHC